VGAVHPSDLFEPKVQNEQQQKLQAGEDISLTRVTRDPLSGAFGANEI